MKRGNCYVTCEALYHLLGGKAAGWKPMHMYHEGGEPLVLDKNGLASMPTRVQYSSRPDSKSVQDQTRLFRGSGSGIFDQEALQAGSGTDAGHGMAMTDFEIEVELDCEVCLEMGIETPGLLVKLPGDERGIILCGPHTEDYLNECGEKS